jgi:benzylsuccinate CoA-transferase BbsE subunit
MSLLTSTHSSALTGIRVLQLSSPKTQYAGKLFAELGADVILVEKPQTRQTYKTNEGVNPRKRSEAELDFEYFNTSKKSITLNLDSAAGQQLFKRLSNSCQLIIEAHQPNTLEMKGLGYQALAASNPSLVMTRITAFGQTGPYAQFEANDLTLLAMGGLLSLGGYAGAAPMSAWGQQAYLAANQFAAVASMMAVLGAESSGQGQQVDVSIQECVIMALENSVQFFELEGVVRKRYGGEQREAGSGIFDCADGQVSILAGGIGATLFWDNFCQWMLAEKIPGAEQLQGEHWTPAFRSTQVAKEIFEQIFSQYASQHTKAEIYAQGQARRVPICPINTTQDSFANKQLAHRNFFIERPDSEGNQIKMPGAPYILSETPWQWRSPAARPGAHNQEIYLSLGLSMDEINTLTQEGVL